MIQNVKKYVKRLIAEKLFNRPVIKIHGLLRVGTNYTQALLTENFHVVCLDSLEGGWKHGPCNFDPEKKYIFVVKNPYAWLVSFRNWENIHNRSSTVNMEEFITQPLSHRQLKEEWGLNDPIEAWNRTIASWLAYYDKKNTVFIRYEDLIIDFETQLSGIRDKFSLRMKSEKFANIFSRVDSWETPKPRKSLQVDYYRQEKYLEEFDEKMFALLRDRLDKNLLSKFDYLMQ